MLDLPITTISSDFNSTNKISNYGIRS